MNNGHTTNPLESPQGPEHIDRVLRTFFVAQMPAPWPAAPAVSAAPTPAPTLHRSWQRVFAPRQLALVAAVLLFVLGYFAVSHSFPDAQTAPAAPGARPLISRELEGPRAPTPQPIVPRQKLHVTPMPR